MLLSYIPLFILLVLAIVVAGVVLIFGRFFGPRHPNAKKNQSYESGMIPYGPGTRQMSVKYYLVAVLFILFDVEVIFFLPWAVAFKSMGLFTLVEMLIFVGILLVAFIYIWKKGALEWE